MSKSNKARAVSWEDIQAWKWRNGGKPFPVKIELYLSALEYIGVLKPRKEDVEYYRRHRA